MMGGAMNGPHKEPKPELRIEAHYDSFGSFDDSKYRAERKERNEAKQKALKKALKDMTAEKALAIAKNGIEKALKQCEISAMEYDEPSISDAYDDKD